MGVEAADRTLFVGNLHPRATEELLFELFLQAGPAVNVKIPKDKDGKPKLFAFVNFKHEESVPYGMNLLNGIKLFGRPLKIQYRSGSTHMSQDANNSAQSPQGNMIAANSPTPNDSRQEGNDDMMKYNNQLSFPNYQRSYSSPDNLQRQAMMNNLYKQESYGSRAHALPQSSSPPPSSFPQSTGWHNPNYNYTSQHRYDSDLRPVRSHASHPYKNEQYHNREVYNRSGREEQHYRNRGHDSPNSRKEPRWGQSHR